MTAVKYWNSTNTWQIHVAFAIGAESLCGSSGAASVEVQQIVAKDIEREITQAFPERKTFGRQPW
jgi:hypothetical protein